jgi:peptidoglycan hydrolase-like protein with peptidoglycan-binding domain
MDTERATQIQSALIKSGYMTGEPSGTWDAETASAMQKLQGDNGWQTRITPDSRALIKLGLGPQRDYHASNVMPQ